MLGYLGRESTLTPDVPRPAMSLAGGLTVQGGSHLQENPAGPVKCTREPWEGPVQGSRQLGNVPVISTALWEAHAAPRGNDRDLFQTPLGFAPQLQCDRHSLEALTMSVSHRQARCREQNPLRLAETERDLQGSKGLTDHREGWRNRLCRLIHQKGPSKPHGRSRAQRSLVSYMIRKPPAKLGSCHHSC